LKYEMTCVVCRVWQKSTA